MTSISPIRIQNSVLNAETLREAARGPESGAIVVFEGCARDNHMGKAVKELSYEAYESMALAQLEKIRIEAMKKFSLHACLVHHRTGVVPLAEAAIVTVCASTHRSESLQATAWLLDSIKESVPIWKREYYQDGGVSWIEGNNAIADEQVKPIV